MPDISVAGRVLCQSDSRWQRRPSTPSHSPRAFKIQEISDFRTNFLPVRNFRLYEFHGSECTISEILFYLRMIHSAALRFFFDRLLGEPKTDSRNEILAAVSGTRRGDPSFSFQSMYLAILRVLAAKKRSFRLAVASPSRSAYNLPAHPLIAASSNLRAAIREQGV